MYKFEVYTDKKGEFRFRFRARNGEPMFSSEGYTAKTSALRAIESIRKNTPGASLEDLTKLAKAAKPAAKTAKPRAAAKAKPKARTAKAPRTAKAKATA